MFAPGMPRTTPGTVRVRLTKLRPLSGSCWICCSSTVVPSSEDDVCTRGETPVTVIVSATAPTSSCTVKRRRISTPSRMSGIETVLNPESSADNVYVAGRQRRRRKLARAIGDDDARPAGFDVGQRHGRAGETAPELSWTVPRMVPVTACAASKRGKRIAAARKYNTALFMLSSDRVRESP